MGVLSRMVFLLEKLDLSNKKSLYELKLHLIQNCIYGVDIQNIATQISKLRFFISLIVEQKESNNDAEDNYGVHTLPNLETKFVTANALIGLEKEHTSLFSDERKVQKTLNKLISNDLIILNKEKGIVKQQELTPERYVKAIMLDMEIFYLNVSEEIKKQASILILKGNYSQKKEKRKNLKKQIEQIQSKNWLLILNDLNKLSKSEFKDLFKKAFYERIRGSFDV